MWWEGVYGRWVGVNFSKVCLDGLIGATRSWGSGRSWFGVLRGESRYTLTKPLWIDRGFD